MENRENVQELHKKHSDHLKINITGVRFYDNIYIFATFHREETFMSWVRTSSYTNHNNFAASDNGIR